LVHAWELGATLNDMLVAADHATHVVRSIKTLGAQRSQREPNIDLNECIHEAITLLSSPLRRVQVELNLQVNLPPFTGNHGELVQVLVNIIQNAYESMIASRQPHPLLAVSSEVGEDAILIHIQDNGPGIPPEILPHIFEPSITTKTDGLSIGLGLGLTIVQRLVSSYDGSIDVVSEPGKTVFTLQFPLGGNQ
jgi:C4-dicarboxylate-specific signal transduction histidine kinase